MSEFFLELFSEEIPVSLQKNLRKGILEGIKKILDNSTNSSDLYELNYKEAKEKFERDYLILKLKNNNWNMTLTSKTLKLDRVSLYRKIKSLNIKID